MDALITNARIYATDEVILGDIFLSGEHTYILTNVENRESIPSTVTRINAGNNILLPGIIELSPDFSSAGDSDLLWQMLPKVLFQYGASLICPIISVNTLQKLLSIYDPKNTIGFWKFRLRLGTYEDLRSAEKLIKKLPQEFQIIDLILPLKLLRDINFVPQPENNIRLCLEINHTNEANDDLLSNLKPEDCLSIPANLIKHFENSANFWVEWRLPSPGSLIFDKLGNINIHKKIVRSYWGASHENLNVLDVSPKDQLYFIKINNHVFMPPNYAARYLNRGLKIPLNTAFSLITLNNGRYIRLDNDQVIQSGPRCPIIIIDGKLDLIKGL